MAANSPKFPYKFQAVTNKLYKKITDFEDDTNKTNRISKKDDADIRDTGKKQLRSSKHQHSRWTKRC